MDPDLGWAYERRTDAGRISLTLSGEIDMTGSGSLEQLLQGAVRGAEVVTVDFAAVRFIDSTVIGVLVSANNVAAASGCAFTVVNASAQVRRVLQMTGVLDSLTA